MKLQMKMRGFSMRTNPGFWVRRISASVVLALGAWAVAPAAHAATVRVDVGGDFYDVSTLVGSYNDNRTLLMNQIWFGDFTLASAFANAVAGSLGFPNTGGSDGPLIAYEEGSAFSEIFPVAYTTTGNLISDGQFQSSVRTFATATAVAPVPLPAGALLLISGVVLLSGVRRRKKAIAGLCR